MKNLQALMPMMTKAGTSNERNTKYFQIHKNIFYEKKKKNLPDNINSIFMSFEMKIGKHLTSPKIVTCQIIQCK